MTLNQLVAQITEFGEKHEMIATTYYGAAMDKLAESDVTYPMFTFNVTNGQINGQELVLSFSMFFFDRLQADKTNEQEVHSDMLQIAQDIIAQLRYQGWEFVLQDQITINLFTDDTPEMLAGVNAEIGVSLPYQSDRCAVPSTLIY
jgi:hypothetical protein